MAQKALDSVINLFKTRPDLCRTCEFGVFALFIAISANIGVSSGVSGLARYYVETLRKLPFVNSLIRSILDNEVKGALGLLTGANDSGATAIEAKLLSIPVSITSTVS